MARKTLSVGATASRSSKRIEARVKIKEAQKLEASPSKSKRFRRPRQRKSCHLLALPGELRNRIYELTVVQTEPVRITRKGPGQSALLKVCRQVRLEAGPIYYGDNKFDLLIESWNGAAFAPFARQARNFTAPINNVNFLYDRGCDWDNLVAWIKAVYAEGALVPAWTGYFTREDHFAFGAFKLADECGYWAWAGKEAMLDVLYNSLRGTDSPWLKYEDQY